MYTTDPGITFIFTLLKLNIYFHNDLYLNMRFFFCLFVFVFVFVFFETGFLCVALAVLELTLYVDQAGLKLRNPPASAS